MAGQVVKEVLLAPAVAHQSMNALRIVRIILKNVKGLVRREEVVISGQDSTRPQDFKGRFLAAKTMLDREDAQRRTNVYDIAVNQGIKKNATLSIHHLALPVRLEQALAAAEAWRNACDTAKNILENAAVSCPKRFSLN